MVGAEGGWGCVLEDVVREAIFGVDEGFGLRVAVGEVASPIEW